MEMFAVLFKHDKSLEVMVTTDRDDFNSNNQVIGLIRFKDNKSPAKIMEQFSKVYDGGFGIRVLPAFDLEHNRYAINKYPLNLEPTITAAFTYYFSKRCKI